MDTSKLEKLAREAGGVQDEMKDAYRDEREAQGEALAALIAAVRPALPALVSPMAIDWQALQEPVRGSYFRLGERRFPSRTGNALYIDAHGRLFWFQGEDGALRWEEVSPQHAAAEAIWPIEAWVGTLGLACEAVMAGKASRAAKSARARAMKLTALAVLLEPEKKSTGGSLGDQLHAPKT